MRTWRLSLTGTIILTLLGGLSGAVAAQEDDDEGVPLGLSRVTGTRAYSAQYQGPTASNDEDRWRYRGALFGYILEVDDPRLSGTEWSTWSKDTFPDESGRFFGTGGALKTGSVEIVNDAGSWHGTAHGYQDPATTSWFIEFDLAGTGAYEGYSALLHVTGPATRKDVNGFIFRGTWPEFPDPVEVPGQ